VRALRSLHVLRAGMCYILRIYLYVSSAANRSDWQANWQTKLIGWLQPLDWLVSCSSLDAFLRSFQQLRSPLIASYYFRFQNSTGALRVRVVRVPGAEWRLLGVARRNRWRRDRWRRTDGASGSASWIQCARCASKQPTNQTLLVIAHDYGGSSPSQIESSL
jgi:hypothetical protein